MDGGRQKVANLVHVLKSYATVERPAWAEKGYVPVRVHIHTCHLGPDRKKKSERRCRQNHSTQDSHVVPHHGTNWAALRLTAQIGRDAVLSESYGRGYWYPRPGAMSQSPRARCPQGTGPLCRGPALKRRANKGR